MEKSGIFFSEKELLVFGERLATVLAPGDLIFLQGNLGAGKTTLARGILHGLGFQAHVKSPTYPIVESYFLQGSFVYHFDLYRISDPQELCDIGLTDYLSQNAIILVEWPEKAFVLFQEPTLSCHMKIITTKKRSILLTPHSKRGFELLSLLSPTLKKTPKV